MLTPLGPLPGQTDRQTAFPGSPLIPAATFTLRYTFPPACPRPALRERHFHRENRSRVWSPGPAPGTAPSVERPLPLCSPYEHSSLRHLEKQLGTPSPAWPLPPPEAAPRELSVGRLSACSLARSSPRWPMVGSKSLGPRSLTPSR